MKKFYTIAAALTMLVLAAGCSKDETPEQPEPKFPGIQEIAANLADSQTLTFSANMDWKLSVTSNWVRFVDGDVRTQQLTGSAGDGITVEIECSDEGQEFDEASADIDMTMGGTTQTIFRIVRDGKERWIKLYRGVGSDEWKQIDSLSLHYNSGQQTVEMQSIRIVANYAWKGTVSDDVTITSGNEFGAEANEYADFTLTVSDEKLPFAFETAFKTTDKDGGNAADFAITYDGMGDEDIIYKGVLQRRASFSKAGKKMTDSEPAVESDSTAIEISVYAKDMKYSAAILYTENNPNVGKITKKADETFWLKLTDDGKGKLTLTADENTSAARTASLVIIPGEGEINLVDDYTEYTITISQESGESENPNGFYGYWAQSLSPITFTAATDEQIAATAQNNLPAGNTYYFSFKDEDVRGGLIFAPLGFLSDYTPIHSYKQIYIEGEWPKTQDGESTNAPVQTAVIGSSNGSGPYDGTNALSYANLNAADFVSGITVFLFYSGADTDMSGAPVAALILEKEGEEISGGGDTENPNGFFVYWQNPEKMFTGYDTITATELTDFELMDKFMFKYSLYDTLPKNSYYISLKKSDIPMAYGVMASPIGITPLGFSSGYWPLYNYTQKNYQGTWPESFKNKTIDATDMGMDNSTFAPYYNLNALIYEELDKANGCTVLFFYSASDSAKSNPLAAFLIEITD